MNLMKTRENCTNHQTNEQKIFCTFWPIKVNKFEKKTGQTSIGSKFMKKKLAVIAFLIKKSGSKSTKCY